MIFNVDLCLLVAHVSFPAGIAGALEAGRSGRAGAVFAWINKTVVVQSLLAAIALEAFLACTVELVVVEVVAADAAVTAITTIIQVVVLHKQVNHFAEVNS